MLTRARRIFAYPPNASVASIVAAAAGLLLAGCIGSPASGSPAAGLSALAASEIEAAQLDGELGCSFSTLDEQLLLVAMGYVASADPAQGVVKLSSVQRVSSPGGFDAMLDGGTFSGPSASIQITLTGGAIGGGESPARPATLTLQQTDGAPQTVSGRWSCGP